MSATDEQHGPTADDRLPLRWGVILTASAGVGILGAFLGGPIVGLCAGLVACGLLAHILGH